MARARRRSSHSNRVSPDSAGLDERTIFSFTISFRPGESSFPPDRYGGEFNRAIQSASTFGNAVVAIRGHSDPTKAPGDEK